MKIEVTKFDDFLYRGARPVSMTWLKSQEFKKVINLQSNVFEFFHQDAYESDIDKDFGLEEKNFPWSDVFAPKVHSLRIVAVLLRQYNQAKVKTYVHCLHGKDRTGMAVASYEIIYKNIQVDFAIQKMYEHGFHKWPYLHLLNWPNQLKELKK